MSEGWAEDLTVKWDGETGCTAVWLAAELQPPLPSPPSLLSLRLSLLSPPRRISPLHAPPLHAPRRLCRLCRLASAATHERALLGHVLRAALRFTFIGNSERIPKNPECISAARERAWRAGRGKRGGTEEGSGHRHGAVRNLKGAGEPRCGSNATGAGPLLLHLVQTRWTETRAGAPGAPARAPSGPWATRASPGSALGGAG